MDIAIYLSVSRNRKSKYLGKEKTFRAKYVIFYRLWKMNEDVLLQEMAGYKIC